MYRVVKMHMDLPQQTPDAPPISLSVRPRIKSSSRRTIRAIKSANYHAITFIAVCVSSHASTPV